MTPITPPVYIHHGPAGSGTNSVGPTATNMVRKINRKLVPIMKLRNEVVKLCCEY
jgi:hypothetical protein